MALINTITGQANKYLRFFSADTVFSCLMFHIGIIKRTFNIPAKNILLFCSLSLFFHLGCASSTALRQTTSKNFLYCLAVQDTLLITGGGGGIDVYSINNHLFPRQISSVFTGSSVAGIAVRWPKVFAACGKSGLVTTSFIDPQNPKTENVCDLQMNALAVDIIDSFAIVIGIDNYKGYLKVVAMERTPPQVLDSFSVAGSISSIHCEDSTIFICGTESWTGFLRTYMLNRLSGKVKSLSGIALDAPAWDVTSKANMAVTAQGDKGVFIANSDISGRLTQISSTQCGIFSRQIAIADSLLFVLNDKQGISVVDFTGKISKTIAIKSISHFAVSYPYIYASLANKTMSVITYK
jgi:hypothetical protein